MDSVRNRHHLRELNMKKTVAAVVIAGLTAISFAAPSMAATVVLKVKPVPHKVVIVKRKPVCHWKTTKVMTNHKTVVKKTRVCN